MSTRTTRTHANLEVSAVVHAEIAGKLRAAGYDAAFGGDGEIDMHGIAIVAKDGPADMAGIVSEIGEPALLEHIGREAALTYFGITEA